MLLTQLKILSHPYFQNAKQDHPAVHSVVQELSVASHRSMHCPDQYEFRSSTRQSQDQYFFVLQTATSSCCHKCVKDRISATYQEISFSFLSAGATSVHCDIQ